MTKYGKILKTDAELKPCPFCGGKCYIVMVQSRLYAMCDTCTCRIAVSLEQENTIANVVAAWNSRIEDIKCCADCRFFSYDVKLECGICNKPSISTIIDETDRVCRWFSESKDDSDRIERQDHGKHQYRMR